MTDRYESPLVNTAVEAIKYADMVDSKNIGIHLDTYHMNIEENNIVDGRKNRDSNSFRDIAVRGVIIITFVYAL